MHNSLVIVFLMSVMLAQVGCQCEDDQNYQEYLKWKELFNERYENGEDVFRAFIYKQHKKQIKRNNQNPKSSHKEGQTKFMGISKEQFIATYLGAVPPDHNTALIKSSDNDDDERKGYRDIKVNAIATSIDWRQTGGVTSVKNQGACGSCWAFSSVATIQSSYLIKSDNYLDLSEQQLVSCANIYGNAGCNGGWPASALKYPLNYGITTETAYPYIAKTGTCQQDGGQYKIAGIKNTAYGSCDDMRSQLQLRPTSVAVDASDWGYYRSGVFRCTSSQVTINHAVLLIGYDLNQNWIIKNSWGTGWGDKGYMTINKSNMYNCGICKYGSTAAIV